MSKRAKQITEQAVTLSSISDLLDQKFKQIDQRFNGIDRRIDGVDQKLGGMNQRFETIENKLNQTTEIVSDLKEDMDIVKDFLTTKVMTKTDGQGIMTIVNRHTKEIKELKTVASY